MTEAAPTPQTCPPAGPTMTRLKYGYTAMRSLVIDVKSVKLNTLLESFKCSLVLR